MVSGPAAVKPKTPWLLPSMLPWVRGSFSGGFFLGKSCVHDSYRYRYFRLDISGWFNLREHLFQVLNQSNHFGLVQRSW